MRNRPDVLIGVLGTHTEVGKTYVTANWLRTLRDQGRRVAVRKPVQSFAMSDTVTDAGALAAATGDDEAAVCPSHRRYPLPLAPPMAADELGRPRIVLNDLLAEVEWPPGTEIAAIETVGGVLSPIAHDGDSMDLLEKLRVDAVLLVAEAGLGALNAIRLSLARTAQFRSLVFLNRYDDQDSLHRMNRRWLVEKYRIATAVRVEEIQF